MATKKEEKKKYVTLELFTRNDGTEKDVKYKGRLIGVVDEEEFAKIVASQAVQARISTSETKPLDEITENFSDMAGLRLVMSITEVDNEELTQKKLFITERLGLVSEMNPREGWASITGQKGGWMMISEEEE